jgi:PLP dependent protein
MKSRLRDNLARVEERIAKACARAHRPRDSVTLVAVTKTVALEVAALLPDRGVMDLGESRPQELWRKADAITGVRWHLIGHLQRNKIEKTVPLVRLIHSVDSERLLNALESAASGPVEVLLEVNASGELSKTGLIPGELSSLVPTLCRLRRVQVRGLMTMAALQDPEACRPTFALLRGLLERLRAECPKHRLNDLSMGMSNDFEVAIEEGATLIRLGTVLFEGIKA